MLPVLRVIIIFVEKLQYIYFFMLLKQSPPCHFKLNFIWMHLLESGLSEISKSNNTH